MPKVVTVQVWVLCRDMIDKTKDWFDFLPLLWSSFNSCNKLAFSFWIAPIKGSSVILQKGELSSYWECCPSGEVLGGVGGPTLEGSGAWLFLLVGGPCVSPSVPKLGVGQKMVCKHANAMWTQDLAFLTTSGTRVDNRRLKNVFWFSVQPSNANYPSD